MWLPQARCNSALPCATTTLSVDWDVCSQEAANANLNPACGASRCSRLESDSSLRGQIATLMNLQGDAKPGVNVQLEIVSADPRGQFVLPASRRTALPWIRLESVSLSSS